MESLAGGKKVRGIPKDGSSKRRPSKTLGAENGTDQEIYLLEEPSEDNDCIVLAFPC